MVLVLVLIPRFILFQDILDIVVDGKNGRIRSQTTIDDESIPKISNSFSMAKLRFRIEAMIKTRKLRTLSLDNFALRRREKSEDIGFLLGGWRRR